MKKIILTLGFAMAASYLPTLRADDSASKPMTREKPVLRERVIADDNIDRKLELRLGPRLTFLTGDVKAGLNGTPFEVWNDLRLDEPSGGIKFDADWQPIDRWHLTFGTTWDHYDQSGTTTKDISNGGAGSGRGLVSGSTVRADMEMYSFEGTLGYDVIKTHDWRIRPYVGGKGYLVDGSVTTINNGAGGSGVSRETKGTRAEGTYLVGIDNRFTIPNTQFYLGADLGASVWNNYYLLTGEAYAGYDFSRNFGIRFGYAADYVDYENSGRTTSAQPLLGAAYVQAVWGF